MMEKLQENLIMTKIFKLTKHHADEVIYKEAGNTVQSLIRKWKKAF